MNTEFLMLTLGATAIALHYLDYHTTSVGLTKYGLSEGNPLGRWVMRKVGLRTAIIFMKVAGGLGAVGILWLLAPSVVWIELLIINLVGAIAVINNRMLIKEKTSESLLKPR